MYSAQGIFQHHFQSKKVLTILDKIRYLCLCHIKINFETQKFKFSDEAENHRGRFGSLFQ